MLKRSAYIKTVRRPYPPLFLSAIWVGNTKPKYYRGLIRKSFVLVNEIQSDAVIYYAKKELKKIAKIVFDEWQNQKQLKKVEKILKHRETILIKSTKKSLNQFLEAYKSYSVAIVLAWAAEDLVIAEIKRLLQLKISKKETEKLLDKLNTPLRDNFYKQKEKDLVLSENLIKLAKKYEWINSRYGEIKPYTPEQAKQDLKKIDKKNFLSIQKQEKKEVEKFVNLAKNILKNKSGLADLMQFLVYYRTQRTDIINKAQYLAAPLLKKEASKRGLSYKQFIYCLESEVLGSLPEVKILNQRIKDYALVMEKSKVRCAVGPECVSIRKLFKESGLKIVRLVGKVAYRGHVRGFAKLIFSTLDFKKIKKNDILVSPMTNPHMVPIMKRAAAFVTDEGGITCHAAIMSREMKKPCVIGTRIATQVLKDGDRVEVDAIRGIVKKI